MRLFYSGLLWPLFLLCAHSQTPVHDTLQKPFLDSVFISETEDAPGRAKILHAEPLYIDLIRDLGARKGEREWNVGMGLTDQLNFDKYEALVEYEFAPMDRLGLEIELPFSFYYPVNEDGRTGHPGSRLNGLKLAAQWTFLVSEKAKTSLAVGYLNELEFVPFRDYGHQSLLKGNIYNPFFVAAKRWGSNYHTLVYAGPVIEQHFSSSSWHTAVHINTNLHYMIPGTRNFIGVEFNKQFHQHDFDLTIRPQMRLAIVDNLMIGIVTGIPVSRETQRLSTFIRLIYEPGHVSH